MEQGDRRVPVAEGGHDDAAQRERWTRLAGQRSVQVPPGPLEAVVNRVLAYGRPEQIRHVLPYLSPDHGGLVIAAGGELGYRKSVKPLREAGIKLPFLLDPVHYQKHIATVEQPFYLPPHRSIASSLEQVCDDQLSAGAPLALTSTGFVRAGDTDVLRAILDAVVALDRRDIVALLPVDVSLLCRSYFSQTFALLAQAGVPVALVLCRQFDPFEQSRHLARNLRQLAAAVPLLAIRTDLNALDLVAHGSICGAIGLRGTTRHAVEPPGDAEYYNSERLPHVLVPDLASWWHSSKLNKLFGPRPRLAPPCDCRVCGGQRLTRFASRRHEDEACAHDVAAWTRIAEDLLDAPTLLDRAVYWRNVARDGAHNHDVFAKQLNLQESLDVQAGLRQWADQPAWHEVISPARP